MTISEHATAGPHAIAPVVQVRGSNLDIGRAIGETARPQIRAAVEYYTASFHETFGLSKSAATTVAHAHLRVARRYLPQYVEELEGMAEASGVEFDDLLVLNCGEEISPLLQPAAPSSTQVPPSVGGRGCTALALSGPAARLVAQNMDWCPADADKNIFYDITVPDGTRFVTFAGAPYLPILGMNSHGIAYGGNSFVCTGNRTGIPNAFIRRWVLEASSVPEAVGRACHPARARGSNHLLEDAAGCIVNLETSATASARVELHETNGCTWVAHTNHYLSREMESFEGYLPTWRSSFRRLDRAQEMVAEGLRGVQEPDTLAMTTLRDHQGSPFSICEHEQESVPLADRSMTVASTLFDLTSLTLLACGGRPCTGAFAMLTMG